jgi:iron complex transport system ATP-binding protein
VTAALEINGVTVRFNAAAAVSDVSMRVAPGEWLALIGPNGAGKTSLLHAIASALEVSEGSINVEGDALRSLPSRERARRMAVVPQEQALPAGWTVGQVVAQGRAPHLGTWRREGPADREAVSAALRSTATDALALRAVESLSGGERQRVLLARALAQAPHILLLDEPTAFLDLQFQWEMLELVEEARRERGLTVVSVLHDLNLAAAFADRVALLKGGRVLALGAPADVMTEEAIEAGYGRRVTVGVHPATGRPTVLSWPSDAAPNARARIHVIGGGGSAAAILRRLASDGNQVTTGVLNVGDTDWETARALGLSVADEAPFSAISSAAFQRAERLIRKAAVVLVAPTAVGPGNMDNLRLAVEAAQRGQRVLLTGEMGPNRDFTGGGAARLWDAAVAAGAVEANDLASAIQLLLP